MTRARLAFADLAGWAADDHAAAFAAFRRSADRIAASPQAASDDWRAVAAAARLLSGPVDATTARRFFETWFRPTRVAGARPFLTGYYEPELAGSRVATARFRVPLHGRPDDLIDITDANRPPDFPADLAFAPRMSAGQLVPYHTRAAIEDGALDGRGLELVYVEDVVDAFFVHVQGSCRIRLDDGTTLRLAYAGKTGHPYTSIGRLLVERGAVALERMTGAVLAAWLRDNPTEGRALMRQNRSYIFFRQQDDLDPALGAVAAGGVPLTPGRSLAVDHSAHAYGTPVWLDADLPLGPDGALRPWRRLMLAQDTGSAIVGPARGDIFIGCGALSGDVAGRIRHQAHDFVVLVPSPNRS